MADILWLAIVSMLAPVFVGYGKLKVSIEKPLSFVMGAGLFFLLAVGFETALWATGQFAAYGPAGSMLFQFLGWLMLLIGTLWGVYNVLKK
ncbi:MAG: hypothetical protein GXO64_02095 [Candidatus Micrarchaeota archaeon]|nr:hypothetical protein [Candidatus Micrarchaeota archaeon]